MERKKVLYMKADLPNLLEMTAKEVRAPGISLGFALSLDILRNIAEHAIRNHDKYTIEQLERLSIIVQREVEEPTVVPCSKLADRIRKSQERGRR